MFTFALLLMLLVLPCTRTIGNKTNRNSPRTLASSAKNVHSSYAEVVYCDPAQLLRRRLLEHPRWMKQAQRSNGYGIQRRHQPRHRFDEGRSYRSAVKDDDDEDEDEEEEEEDEDEEEDEANQNENLEEEENEENNEEETVAAIVGRASDGRMMRSGYVPYMANVGRRARRQGNPTTVKECEYETEPTEVPQYYEYETHVKDVASQDIGECQAMLFARMFGAGLLILLLH